MNRPATVEGNARRRSVRVTRSSVELKYSMLETEEDRRRVDEVAVDASEEASETVEATEATEVLRSQTLGSPGTLAVRRRARMGAGIVMERFNVGRVKGETLTEGGAAATFV